MARWRRLVELPWRSRAHITRELDEEFRFHLDMRAQELEQSGMGAARAREEALREFGDLDGARRRVAGEDARASWRARLVDRARDAGHDVALAARALRRAPGFSAVVLLTLALGIGANTAVFGVVRAIVLRTMPWTDPSALVRLYMSSPGVPNRRGQLSAADFVDVRRQVRGLAGVAGMSAGRLTIARDGEAETWNTLRVTSDFFDVLGSRAALGRTFATGEDAQEGEPVVVLSHERWRQHFGGDPDVVGKTLVVGERGLRVIGVMPEGFVSPVGLVDAWTPLRLEQVLRDEVRRRKWHWMEAVARMRPGVTAATAQAELDALAARLEREHPESNTGYRFHAFALRDELVGPARTRLLLVMGAAGLVLLIACANVAGLLLARTVTRRRELAIRVALGAGRARLARLLLAESALLGAAGGALGVALAWWTTGRLAILASGAIPDLGPVRVDALVLLFALAATLGSVLLVGLVPALAAGGTAPQGALASTALAAGGGTARRPLRLALVVSQLAMASVLLVGAGLLVRSLVHLQRTALGFRTEGVLTFDVGLSGNRYDSRDKQAAFMVAMRDRLAAIPGVRGVASIGVNPLFGHATSSLGIEGRAVPEGELPEVGYVPVSDDYFRVLGIPLREGRAFDGRDHDGATDAYIVSESLARRFWPDGGAVGRRIRLGPNQQGPWGMVVGVVGDVRNGATEEPHAIAYSAQRQDAWGGGTMLVATTGDPMAVLPAVRAAMRELDPALPLQRPRPMRAVFGETLAGQRLPMVLLAAFAALAMVVSAVGLYGVTAQLVAARTREFGVRMALGADAGRVRALVLAESARTAAVGLVLGLGAAFWLSRLLTGLVHGVSRTDPLTFAGAAAVLLAATFLASWLPARRATRVEPVEALRSN
jgi:putative ABC transport system permease protein